MKNLMIKSFGWAVLAAVATFAAHGQQQPAAVAPTTTAQTNRIIVVSLRDRKMALVQNGLLKKTYTVAVGKPSTPSPEGTFTIERQVAHPVYHHGDQTIAPGPANPVGSRWMGLNKAGYGIHGTNEPRSIGKAASHGCIRMAKADLEEFYELVAVGDEVQIVSRPDEQTARFFAAPSKMPAMSVGKPEAEVAKDESSLTQNNPAQNLSGATR